VTRTEIVKLFPGNDPAGIEQAIVQVMDQLHLTTNDLSHDQVLAILDAMTHLPGLIGVAARFAKVRALLLPKRAFSGPR
jgi:hypothetical protein